MNTNFVKPSKHTAELHVGLMVLGNSFVLRADKSQIVLSHKFRYNDFHYYM